MKNKYKNTDMIKIGDSEVSVKDFKKWLKALRSGKYKQTKGTLQDGKGFCCLGVACDIFIPKDKKYLDESERLMYKVPDLQPYSPTWLRWVNIDFKTKTNHVYSKGNSTEIDDANKDLMEINDSLNFTFGEIADTLEAVYLLKVLE